MQAAQADAAATGRRGWQRRVEDRVLDFASGWSAQAARVSEKGSFGFPPWSFLTCEQRPDSQNGNHPNRRRAAAEQMVQQLCGGRCSERCAG